MSLFSIYMLLYQYWLFWSPSELQYIHDKKKPGEKYSTWSKVTIRYHSTRLNNKRNAVK